MKNVFEELGQKINDGLARDEVYLGLNNAAEECKAEIAQFEQQAPILRSAYHSSSEEFAKYLCKGSTAQYYAEEARYDVDKYLSEAHKHGLFREEKQKQECLRRAEEIEAELKEFNSFSYQQLNTLSETLNKLTSLHNQMRDRLHEVTRETIKQNYYTKGVQNVFAAVESKDTKQLNDDGLSKAIVAEVNKFIAARDYQIPPREAQPKK